MSCITKIPISGSRLGTGLGEWVLRDIEAPRAWGPACGRMAGRLGLQGQSPRNPGRRGTKKRRKPAGTTARAPALSLNDRQGGLCRQRCGGGPPGVDLEVGPRMGARRCGAGLGESLPRFRRHGKGSLTQGQWERETLEGGPASCGSQQIYGITESLSEEVEWGLSAEGRQARSG